MERTGGQISGDFIFARRFEQRGVLVDLLQPPIPQLPRFGDEHRIGFVPLTFSLFGRLGFSAPRLAFDVSNNFPT
jgi:hypothetical protein